MALGAQSAHTRGYASESASRLGESIGMTVPPSEKVYVLEIGGAPILAFAATSHREAQSLLREEWLRADLRDIRSGGKPIWDGTAKLGVRHAGVEEAERYAAGATGSPDDDDLQLVYLVERDG
jgi:hypothetical protein